MKKTKQTKSTKKVKKTKKSNKLLKFKNDVPVFKTDAFGNPLNATFGEDLALLELGLPVE
jgi:hypothetical protein